MDFKPSAAMNFNPTIDLRLSSNFRPSPAINHGTPASVPMQPVTLGARVSTHFGRSIDRLANEPATAPGGGGGAVTLPFSIKKTSPDAVTPRVKVVFGTIMGFTPTDIATDLTLTDDAVNTIYLLVTIDDAGLVTAAAVTVGTSGVPSDTYHFAYLLIGYVTVAAGLVTQIDQSLYFSQGFKACDRDPEDPVTTPGSYQFFVR